jgi:hypothetical protein
MITRGERIMRMIVVCVIAAIGIYAAQAESPPAPPNWSADRFLLGAWSCDLARPGRQIAHERAVYSLGLADRWLRLTYTVTSTKPSISSVTTEASESFDSRLKKWVYVSLGSDGHYGISYSDGWKGGTKTYGPAPEASEKWRLIATKVSEREFTEDIDITAADGQWHRAGSLRCRKTD